MHCRLRLARRSGGKAEQGHIVPTGLHRQKLHWLVERDPIEFGIMVGGAVKADDRFEIPARLAAVRP